MDKVDQEQHFLLEDLYKSDRENFNSRNEYD